MVELVLNMSLRTLIENDRTFHQPVNWGVTSIMIGLHLGALGALFFFTWQALILAIVLWWVAGSLGIGMGYHRWLTQRGYKTPKFVEYILTTCGTLAIQGGSISWVATHRMHDQNTDKDRAPHSTHYGVSW